MPSRLTLLTLGLSLLSGALLSGSARADDDDDDDDVSYPAAPLLEFEAVAPSAAPMKMRAMATDSLSATPGGAQDIRYFRDQVASGAVPHPNVFTPEGLFSEHDLPVPGGTCEQLLCPVASAIPANLTVQTDVRYLAQLGFHTGIDAASFRRAPLNLVAVIDKSGSMSGQPLETVKASLRTILDQLGPDDQLSIVLYGDRSYVHLQPTRGTDKAALRRGIDAIASAGSTNMEEGLAVGYELAARTAPSFDGTTRVMLFTDERPNVGRTDATSFMGMAETASKHGVGLTTIGVSTQFGAELATKISSVRGGNLFYFADLDDMHDVFADEFDTMVTELAYDMELRVTPSPGMDLVGVYGLPGDVIRWDPDGSLRLGVATLFPSKSEGGIYFAFAPEAGRPRAGTGSLASVSLSYERPGGKREASTVAFAAIPAQGAPLGLLRGQLLVEEATVLKQATTLHHSNNDQEGAYQLVRGLDAQLRANTDPDLDKERVLVGTLLHTLEKLSGHQGEGGTAVSVRDPISGMPVR